MSTPIVPQRFRCVDPSAAIGLRLAGAVCCAGLVSALPAAEGEPRLVEQLQDQGMAAERILGTDAAGIPVVCGFDGRPAKSSGPAGLSAAGTGSPSARGWECVPSVIRDDGVDSFHLEVTTTGAVAAVTCRSGSFQIAVPTGTVLALRDDGLDGDRVAGDFVFTSEALRYNTNYPLARYLYSETNSPAGLGLVGLGSIQIVELSGPTNEFLIQPNVGVLSARLPLAPVVALSSNVQASLHLANVVTDGRYTQKQLRYLASNLDRVTRPLYGVLPDAFDFLLCFSIDHVETQPRTASANFNAGMHLSAQVNFSGTGQNRFTNTSAYGSSNRLLSLNLVDTGERGIYSQNATHEIMHQWSAFTSTSLGLSDGTGHYKPRGSVVSLVGGVLWTTNLGGGFTLNCDEGRAGAHYAALLDKYMMGLIEASAVPTLYVYPESNPPPYFVCGTNITVIERTVTVANIQSLHGPRVPVPASQPAPYLSSSSWVPVERFFGEGTTWDSEVLSRVVRPEVTAIRCQPPEPATVYGRGYPGVDYTLTASTNFVFWEAVATNTAPANRTLEFTDPRSPTLPGRFYRLKAL
jgi:hypothetical protein